MSRFSFVYLDNMKLSISHLEQLSGVPIHTIRIWERRYNALSPIRSEGNTRIYSDLHLKRLLDIVSLVQSGIKISNACAFSAIQVGEFLEKEIDKTISTNAHFEFYVSQLLKFGIAYNEQKFSEILNTCITSYGLDTSYQQIIYPLLQRVGLLWRKEDVCPGQEHFLTSIIRQKLMVAIDQIPLNTQVRSTWLLFLPEDEEHDIALLYASYILRNNGFRVIYLGEKVPQSSVESVMNDNKIDHLLFFMIRQRPIEEANNYIQNLTSKYDDVKIHISGNGNLINNLDLGHKVNYFKSISLFQSYLQNILYAN